MKQPVTYVLDGSASTGRVEISTLSLLRIHPYCTELVGRVMTECPDLVQLIC